jgi:hypothetical protein
MPVVSTLGLMSDVLSYQGGSAFLRWWPKLMLAGAFSIIVLGWSSIQWATLFAVAAYVHGRWLPYQFTIAAEGLALKFPFGRHLFLPKDAVTVRMEYVGATALVGRRHRFGYLLMDRLLYEPGRNALLRTTFNALGYHLA